MMLSTPGLNLKNLGNLLIIFICSTGLVFAEDQPMAFYLDKAEGGSFSDRALGEFQQYMSEQHCPVQVVNQEDNNNVEFKFSAKPDIENNDGYKVFLVAKTYKNLPVTSAILVHASTGIDDLQSLEKQRVGYISTTSYIGYDVPVKMFRDAGTGPDKQTVYMSGNHDSAMGLLLHGDIFAAVLAGPLAHRWASANELAIIAESKPLDIGKILISKNIDEDQAKKCYSALLNLKRTTYSDKRLNVFPRWVEGFKAFQSE